MDNAGAGVHTILPFPVKNALTFPPVRPSVTRETLKVDLD